MYPVETLRRKVSELEAAVAQVLAKPRKTAVHALRKATRKVEAQLNVIALLERQEQGFRAVRKPARKVSKQLKRIRRAAGAVRDLDVQRKLTKEAATGSRGRVQEEARTLRRKLKVEREAEGEALLGELKAHALALEPRLEELMHVLEPVARVGLSPRDLEVLAREFYQAGRLLAGREKDRAEQMHGVRKAAKVARYMAEDGAPARTVEEFEAMQESGGQWHDWLLLHETSRERLGRGSALAGLLKQKESDAKGKFEKLLAE